MSSELHLKTHPKYKQVTFASGLFLEEPPHQEEDSIPSSGATGTPRVLISYGAGDASGRVLVLSLGEVERLFLKGPG